MSGNYEKVRRSSQLVRSIINGSYLARQTIDPSLDNSALATLFKDVISSRETMISSFKTLSSKKVELFGTLISAYYNSFYSNIIKLNGGFVFSLFAIIDIVGTEEFIRNFERLIFLKQANESNSINSNYEQAIYFEEKFQEISNLSFPDSTISFEAIGGAWVLKEDGSAISDEDIEGNQIYGILYVLGLLKNANNQIISSSNLIARKENFTRRTDGYIERAMENISENLVQIRSSLDSKKYLDSYRKNNDLTYTDKYTLELDASFSEMDEVIASFTDLSIEKVASLKQSGMYQKLPAIINNISEMTKSLLDDIIESVFVIDPFIENYSPFIEASRSDSSKFQSGINLIEGVGVISSVFESFLNPFSSDLVGTTYSQWSTEILNNKSINGDIFQLFLLYVGINIRSYVNESFGKRLSEYVFINLFKKNLIDLSLLEDEFKAKKEIERRLAIDNNIRVVQRPQNDVIPYSLKLNFPDLEVLDYMSFSEIFSIGSAAETAFRKQVKLLMIESLVKDKQNVNRSILRVIEIIKDSAKDNLKTLYIEICLRESMQSIYDFVNGLSVNDTIISNAVREQLGRFLAETSPVGTIISNYLSVWNSFYSQEIDIIDVAVKAGEFKDKLK